MILICTPRSKKVKDYTRCDVRKVEKILCATPKMRSNYDRASPHLCFLGNAHCADPILGMNVPLGPMSFCQVLHEVCGLVCDSLIATSAIQWLQLAGEAAPCCPTSWRRWMFKQEAQIHQSPGVRASHSAICSTPIRTKPKIQRAFPQWPERLCPTL